MYNNNNKLSIKRCMIYQNAQTRDRSVQGARGVGEEGVRSGAQQGADHQESDEDGLCARRPASAACVRRALRR